MPASDRTEMHPAPDEFISAIIIPDLPTTEKANPSKQHRNVPSPAPLPPSKEVFSGQRLLMDVMISDPAFCPFKPEIDLCM